MEGILYLRKRLILSSQIYIVEPYSNDKENAPYAFRVGISKKLEEYWKEDKNTYLRVIVHCSNEWNTASVMYVKNYYKKSRAIQEGDFECGNSMDIVSC